MSLIESTKEYTGIYEDDMNFLILENRLGFQLDIKPELLDEYFSYSTYNEETQQGYCTFSLVIKLEEIKKLEQGALEFLRKAQIVNIYFVEKDGETKKVVMPWKDASISTINSYQKTTEEDGKIIISVIKEKTASEKEAERRMLKMSTVELKLDKNLFNSDDLQLIIADRKINIKGIISIQQLSQLLKENNQENELILTEVNDEQLNNLKEQLVEIVIDGSVEALMKYTQLNGIIIYKHQIYQINNLTVLKNEAGSNSIVFGII